MRIRMTEREDQDCEYSEERFMKEYSVAEERRAPSKSPTCVVRGVLHVYTRVHHTRSGRYSRCYIIIKFIKKIIY